MGVWQGRERELWRSYCPWYPSTLEQLLGIVAVREQMGGTEHARLEGGIQ